MFEAFTVAIRVSLRGVTGFTTGLTHIGSAFAKAHGNAAAFEKRLVRVRALLTGGALVGGAGLAGLMMLKGPIEAASRYQHELMMLRIAGVKQAQLDQAARVAWQTQSLVPTTTPTGNLQSLAELRTVLGQLRDESGKRIVEHATERAASILPQIQQMNYVLENMLDERGYVLHQGHQAYVAAKALELRGATKDMGEFVKQANMMTQAIIATRGRVRPQDFLSAVMYGRRAGYQWNDQFMYRILPTLIQEMQGYGSGGGGVRGPGNALMSAFAEIVGGVIPKKNLPYWAAAGLIGNEKIGMGYQVGSDMKKKIRGLTFSSMKGFEEFVQNPNDYALHYLVPFYQKMGWIDPKNINHMLAPEKIVAYQQKLFPNRTASIMDTMVMRQFLFQRDVPLYEQAYNIQKAYSALVKKDPQAAQALVKAGWESFLTKLGLTILPDVVKAAHALSVELQKLTSYIDKHQDRVRLLVKAFAGLAIVALVAGPLIMFAGIIALIATPAVAATMALMGLVAGAAYIGYFLGKVIRLFFNGVAHKMAQWGRETDALLNVTFTIIKGLVSAGWDYIKTAFSTGFANLKAGVTGFFHSILQWLRDHHMWFGGAGQGEAAGVHPSSLVTRGSGRSPVVGGVHGGAVIHVHTEFNVEGRKIADATSKHFARGLGYASARGRHDPRASLAAAGAGYTA